MSNNADVIASMQVHSDSLTIIVNVTEIISQSIHIVLYYNEDKIG